MIIEAREYGGGYRVFIDGRLTYNIDLSKPMPKKSADAAVKFITELEVLETTHDNK